MKDSDERHSGDPPNTELRRNSGSWRTVLSQAQNRPRMFLGDSDYAHLFAIRYPLHQIWERQVWQRPRKTYLFVSSQQFVLLGESGPLAPEIDELIDFENGDVLIREILHSSRVVNHPRSPIRARFGGSTMAFHSFTTGVELATSAYLAVRNRVGMWGQAYEHGWPVTPVLPLGCEGIGLISARAMTPEWFTGLPYTPERIREIIPAAAAPNVELQWVEDEDLVPTGKSTAQWQEWIHRYLPE